MSPAAQRRLAWSLALAVLAIYLAFLGARGLNEPDEGRYAEIGREMAASGDGLIPRLNGFAHFQKPPLIYWATAASLKLCGVNESAARLPSALAALGTAALTYAMGRRLLGKTGGALAALVLLGSVGYFALSQLLTPDMLMTLWIAGALTCLVEEMHRPAARWRWGFFLAMGLGFLTKGPMAFVVPLSAALGATLAQRRSAAPLALPWARGLALALLIGLSWFLALSLLQPELFTYFWKYELLQRFTSHTHGRSKPFWFFIPVILAGFLPWSVFFPSLARRAWQRLRQKTPLRPLHGLLLGWLLPPFLILSLSGSKLPPYPRPRFPGHDGAPIISSYQSSVTRSHPIITIWGLPVRVWRRRGLVRRHLQLPRRAAASSSCATPVSRTSTTDHRDAAFSSCSRMQTTLAAASKCASLVSSLRAVQSPASTTHATLQSPRMVHTSWVRTPLSEFGTRRIASGS